MRDHTYEGTPVREMARQDIHECLEHGIEIYSSDLECSTDEEAEWVRLRLEIELIIRAQRGETH